MNSAKLIEPPKAGVITALWTPLDEAGAVSIPRLVPHIQWLRTTGISGIMPIGTTGGFVWQDFSGRKKILETVIEHAHGIPAIANISDTRLATVRELGKAAKQLGYSGIALLPPWYFRLPDSSPFFLR